jgi:hypothetical protein
MSNTITYVKAVEDNSCMIACLAMVMGKTFDDVFADMDRYWKNEGHSMGTSDDAWIAYLSAHGYAIQDIDHEYTPDERLINPWPIKPFAPIHIVFVYSEGSHAVVMLQDGTILDPTDIHYKSRHEYHRVYRIVGVWKVRESLDFILPDEEPTTILKAIPNNSTI